MAKQQSPNDILELAIAEAQRAGDQSIIGDAAIRQRIQDIALNPHNRALVRLLLACSLAVVHDPIFDIRKPYKESIKTPDSFSGRRYDERYVTRFVHEHRLPCNVTTAFLTPALRNHSTPLTEVVLVGNPPELYVEAQELLDDVYQHRISAMQLLTETLRQLLRLREVKDQRMALLMESMRATRGRTTLSADAIATLLEQHLRLPNASRLPVLIVTAAYSAAEAVLGERARPLEAHNAADKQTGAVGDVEITLVGDDSVVTAYEMKDKVVTIDDVNAAIEKIGRSRRNIDNYIFITTQRIEPIVQDYARTLHSSMGIEFAILDCIGFVRHYLFLFYRLRHQFLEQYQTMLLAEPESAVSQPLKEAFLTMRLASESGTEDGR